jgi:hypothetical protein
MNIEHPISNIEVIEQVSNFRDLLIYSLANFANFPRPSSPALAPFALYLPHVSKG